MSKVTLYLNPDTWSLELTPAGGLKTASGKYATVQIGANAARTFRGEPYFNTPRGIPYFRDVLGKMPPAQLINAHVEAEVKQVTGAVKVVAVLREFTDRTLKGDFVITTKDGEALNGKY